ncbi:MAG: NAD(P)/FAD-dependent oxidoreductase [Candidatus Bathyarchaeia archaeon]
MEEADIAIVGAGPSGLISAREASLRGVKVIVLEEHSEIGLPCHCAGLLSIKGLREIRVPCDGPHVLNRVRGAHFISPSKLSFTVERKEPIACVVNRQAFDKLLAEQASKSGALIRLSSRVKSVERSCEGRWIINADSCIVKAKILIVAEGAVPRVLRMTGLRTLDISRLLSGLQVDLEGVSLDPDYVEVHFSNTLSPGLFAWVIPLNEEAARVGLACKGSNVRTRLLKFIRRRFGDAVDDKVKFHRFYSGLVITQGPIKRTYGDAMLVVGDAAGQVKPLSGGGVILGGIFASIAGRIASKAVIEGDISKGSLKVYEDTWRGIVGGDLRIALFARRILDRVSDRGLDKIFSAIIKEGIYRDFSEEADMDFHGKLLTRVIKRRGNLRLFLTLLKAAMLS